MRELSMLIFENKAAAAFLILALISTGVSLVCYQLFCNHGPSLEDFVTGDGLPHCNDGRAVLILVVSDDAFTPPQETITRIVNLDDPR